MNNTINNQIQKISESFGLIFLLERKFEYIFDKVLEPNNLTAKQWLVLIAIEELCEGKPSIQEVARQLSTSHQNVKAISLNLQKRGFITLEKDPKDKRVTRLEITTQCKEFWKEREDENKRQLIELFKHITEQEINALNQSLVKLLQGADELSEKINAEKNINKED